MSGEEGILETAAGGHFSAPTDKGRGRRCCLRSKAEIQAFPIQAGSHGAWPGLEHQKGPWPQRGVHWDRALGSVRLPDGQGPLCMN